VTDITEQLASLQKRIRAAAISADRNEDSVTLLAVSKQKSVEAIREAQAAGLVHFGENYLQEALTKIPEIEDPVIWHFIGALQSNKTRAVAEHFDWIHTVSSARIARRLSAQRPGELAPLNVCLQIKPAGGGSRSGIEENELEPLARLVKELPGLELRGLMIVPLVHRDPAETRKEFARVRQYAQDLRQRGYEIDTLSMGMSGDFESAIAEGSTLIRIGTALFGARDQQPAASI
jgi:pyridoxal phosphate enzyme (YggS family)